MEDEANEQVLLKMVLSWLGEEIRPAAIAGLKHFLDTHLPEFKELVESVTSGSLEWAYLELKRLKPKITRLYKENRMSFKTALAGGVTAGSRSVTKIALREAVLKEGAKQLTKKSIEVGAKAIGQASTKTVIQVTTKEVARNGTKKVVRTSTKKVIQAGTQKVVKAGTKKVVSEGAEAVVKQTAIAVAKNSTTAVAKTTATSVAKGTQFCTKAANPIGIASDVAQLSLEVAGFKTAGKAVGASGNLASGVMTGFVVGGPVGAFVGGLTGLGVWYVGEKVGDVVGSIF